MKFFKWLESKLAPVPTLEDYEEETRVLAKKELAQALNTLDHTEAVIAYRTKQLARLNKNATRIVE